MKDQNVDRCMKYFDNEMNEQEQQNFLKEVKADPELNKTFRMQFAIEQFLSNPDRMAFIKSMEEAERRNNRRNLLKNLFKWKK